MTRYPIKHNQYSSHTFVKKQILAFHKKNENLNIKVLDVGCGTGILGDVFLPNDRFEFFGIEPFQNDAAEAIIKGYQVWIESVESALEKIEVKFQIIVAGDVLEHLVNPKAILEELVKRVDSGGILIVTVPNIANILIRIRLLFGNFDYSERGILDKTHLRFFTQKTFKKLTSIQGVHIEKLRMSSIPIEIIIPGLSTNYLGKIILRVLHLVTLLLPKLLGYQHLCVLRKD